MSANLSFNSSFDHLLLNCLESRPTILIFTSLLIIDILLQLPLLLFVLYLGLQRWRQQRSASTSAIISHSDFFTYNMVFLDLIGMLASGLYCFGGSSDGRRLQWVGNAILALTTPAQTLVHLLTCVERYVAVVYPITYRTLKQATGIRIRNISMGCVLLVSFGFVGLTQTYNLILITIAYFGMMIFFLVAICFCTYTIVCVLNHPGPGDGSGDRERVDQSKQRALHTVVSIMVALLFMLFAILVCCLMFSLPPLTHTKCAVGSSAMLLAKPGSVVLPLLFLQRAGKLPGCKHKTDSAKTGSSEQHEKQ